MTHSRIRVEQVATNSNYAADVSDQETLPETPDTEFAEDLQDAFETVLDTDDDFDVEEDIAFLGEDYDVLEIDDVLEMCKVSDWNSLKH